MAETRVSNIEKMAGVDGPVWVTSFEGKKLTLTEKTEPTYQIGDILPFSVKVVKPPEGQKGQWYYVRVDGGGAPPQAKTAAKQSKSYTADPQKIESIELQNNKNNAVNLYCHITEQGTPFDKDRLNEIFQVVKALGSESYLVKAAKEMGAVEK